MFALCSRWSSIETAPGVYSAEVLADLDSIITFHRQSGVTIIFGVYGTPLFYAQTAANPTYGDHVTVGPWGALGECSYPNSLPAVAAFVELIVQRYNLPGGAWFDAHGATLGKGIQYWEPWNEPYMKNSGNEATASGQQVNAYWWGTNSQMVDMVQTQYARVKLLDADIKVSSPAIGDNTLPEGMLGTFFTTTGAVTNKTGAESCDAVAYHPYFAGPPGTVFGDWQRPYLGDIVSGTLGVTLWKSWLARNGYAHDLWITEWGMDTSSGTATLTAWYAQPDNFRYAWVARVLMAAAAQGVKMFHPWGWDAENSGHWKTDTGGVVRAYNEFSQRCCGKTILRAAYVPNGSVTLEMSDGTSWTV